MIVENGEKEAFDSFMVPFLVQLITNELGLQRSQVLRFYLFFKSVIGFHVFLPMKRLKPVEPLVAKARHSDLKFVHSFEHILEESQEPLNPIFNF